MAMYVVCRLRSLFSSDLRVTSTLSLEPGRNLAVEKPRRGVMACESGGCGRGGVVGVTGVCFACTPQ